jgi:molybdopterin synthase sulfur carrier subunit
MSIQVKFFASLKETLNIDDHDIKSAATVGEVWDIPTTNAERPNHVLVAMNLEYAHFESTVKDGDEVAFFPPVTGG